MINLETRQELWPYERFDKLAPYELNRDIEHRVGKVVKLLAEKYLITHSMVVVGRAIKPFGRYNTNDYFRLDGTTRAEAYRLRPDLVPNKPFLVTVIDFDNKEDADAHYYSIDSSYSVETSSDKVTGYLRERDYNAMSRIIQKGRFKVSLDNACRYGHNEDGLYLQTAPFNKKLDYFWDEITYIDSLGLDDIERYSAHILTVFLLIAKKYGVHNERFNLLVENYKNGVTTINDGREVDGVHFVYNDVYSKNIKMFKLNNRSVSGGLICQILFAFNKFMMNDTIKRNTRFPSERRLAELYQFYLTKD